MGCVDSADEVITGLDVWHLRLPVSTARDHGIGRVSGAIEVIVIRLRLSGGICGFGEASPWSVFTGTPEANFAAVDRYMRPLIEGRRLSERHQIMADITACVAHCTEAKAAVETALLDAAGRLCGLPVSALLGGAVRDKIPLSCSLANPEFDEDIALAERLIDDGVRIVKLKTGFGGHDFDMMRLEQLRKRFPQLNIRVDYNQGLSAAHAQACVCDVASFKPDFIEQPVAAPLYAVMARLREAVDSPLLADESVFSATDMQRAITENICDGVSVKIMKAGSLSESCRIAAMAGAAGLSAYGGDMFETGLAHLAGTHMVAAAPNITLGCEFYQARYYLKDDILSTPFVIKDGYVHVPAGPGLGAEIDVDKLEFYCVCHAGSQEK